MRRSPHAIQREIVRRAGPPPDDACCRLIACFTSDTAGVRMDGVARRADPLRRRNGLP